MKAQLDAKSVECLSRIETIQDLRKQIELLSNAPVKNEQSLVCSMFGGTINRVDFYILAGNGQIKR